MFTASFKRLPGAFLLALGVLAPAAHADEAQRVRAEVAAVVQPLMAEQAIPGMAVGVIVQGRPYVLNFGVAAKSKPVTDATLFEVGSVSKTLTATLAAYAQVSGKLSLSDPPGSLVPALRGKPIDAVSLLHLATYTAGGLPLQFPEAVADNTAALAYYAAWRPEAQPGSVRQYSNPSIGLLGLAASKAFGQSFEDAMQSQVFAAFGMAHSFIRVPKRSEADYAWGHLNGKTVRVKPGAMDAQTYGVKTTASDLLRFVQANIDAQGLAEPMQRAVALTHVAYFDAGAMVQGLGWEQYAYPASLETLLKGNGGDIIFEPQPVRAVANDQGPQARLFNKTGSTGGFGAYVLFVPSEKFGLVLLANKSYPIPERVQAAVKILQRLLKPAAR